VAINLEQARAAAMTLTGIAAVPTITPGPASVERAPFVGQLVAGLGPVWQIAWQGIRLSLPSARGAADRHARNVIIRIAQGTGQFLGGTIRAEGELPANVRPTPDGDVAQAQLRQLGESYEGLPRLPPRRSLVQALDAILSRGVGNPLQAHEIQALYVTHVRRGGAPIPAWVITLNGIPPIPHKGPRGARVPVWQRNHIRNVVDANTGAPLFATTVPQPTAPLLVS